MWVMISGPYATGADTTDQKAENLRALNTAALEVFRLGHTPVIGVNMALPMIWSTGASDQDEAHLRIMMPISLALARRCDACLRVGGTSKGADEEVALFRAAGKPVYLSVNDIPGPDRSTEP